MAYMPTYIASCLECSADMTSYNLWLYGLWSKNVGLGEWSVWNGYPLDYDDYLGTCGASKNLTLKRA